MNLLQSLKDIFKPTIRQKAINTMSTTNPIQSDGNALALSSLKVIQTAVDNILTNVENAVPTLSADAITFVTEYIDNHIGGIAGVVLKSLLGVFSGTTSAAVSTPILALLTVAKTRIDADFAALEGKV